MTVRFGRYIVVIFLALTVATASAAAHAHQSRLSTLYPSMPWQILPGEDIAETARLVYPKDPIARDNLIRAFIRINPDHFPQGTNRSLTAGTIIQFPDLRTIGAYGKKTVAKQQRRNSINRMTRIQSQKTPVDAITAYLKNNPLAMQLIDQLEKTAINESHELTVLSKHIAALEVLLNELQSISPKEVPATSENAAADTPNPAPIENTIPAPDLTPQSTVNIETEERSAPQQQDVVQLGNQSSEFNEAPEASMEISIFTDTVFLLGIFLTPLIVFALFRVYRSIRQRFPRSGASSISKDDRSQYEALLLRRKEVGAAQSDQLPESSSQIMTETNSLIEQNNSDAAIELLQKQLTTNQRDIKGWLQLFELLYKANNKRDFKKNARRFKRMKEFPDIWVQIQDLGSRMEPNESLYFNEQKRKEKFFPESMDSQH